ncbi:MAG: fimbrial protein [Kluyvera sp.]|uniref:fimbrial protein n=1 Tax=Kluyvera sp. TaxID=1538228 RepID=UPI003F3A689D
MASIKKNVMAGMISLVILPLSWGVQAASDTATINITATVVDNTCTPEWTAAVPVNLGRAAVRDFTAPGAVGASSTFDLKLKDCGADTTKVKVTASGAADGSNSELFKNTGGATGVGIALFGDATQSTQLKPGSGEVEYDIAGKTDAVMTFKAELRQSADAKPAAGDVVSMVTLTMAYE